MTGKSPVQTSCVADLDGLEVEVVVQMQVVEILAMDEEVQHVVTLATHLQPNLDPVQHSCLEELGCLEGPEQIPEKKKKERSLSTVGCFEGPNKYLREKTNIPVNTTQTNRLTPAPGHHKEF